jgi:hypothetical protein
MSRADRLRRLYGIRTGVSLMSLSVGSGGTPPLSITYGPLGTNYGTSFDYYISPTGNDTTGDGSVGNPYASMAKIKAVSGTAGGTVGVRGGTYAEDYFDFGDTLRSAALKFYAYNGETPVFSGQAALTGWTQCTDTVENAVGQPLEGVSGANIGNYWKKTGVTHGTGGTLPDQYSMHLHEAGVVMPLARRSLARSTINEAWLLDPDNFLTADSATPHYLVANSPIDMIAGDYSYIDNGSMTDLRIGSTSNGTVGISGQMERFVFDMENYLDASLTATQQTLYNRGLQDMSVVITTLGATPDIAMRGTDMLSSGFTNDGDGGTPVKTGTGTITAI